MGVSKKIKNASKGVNRKLVQWKTQVPFLHSTSKWHSKASRFCLFFSGRIFAEFYDWFK